MESEGANGWYFNEFKIYVKIVFGRRRMLQNV